MGKCAYSFLDNADAMPLEAVCDVGEIEAGTGLGRMGLWRLLKRGEFPPPTFRIGRRLWLRSTIRSWLDAHGERDAPLPAQNLQDPAIIAVRSAARAATMTHRAEAKAATKPKSQREGSS